MIAPLIAIFALTIFTAIIIGVGSFIEGYVLSKLWLWFIVPVFHLPSLNIACCVGLSLLAGMLTHQEFYSEDNRPAAEKLQASIAALVFRPLIVLLIGYLVSLFL